MLTEETARALVPLLLSQPYLDRVSIVSAGVVFDRIDPQWVNVDVSLDAFRNQPALMSQHLIVSHARSQGIRVDPNESLLQLPIEESAIPPRVVVSLTPRHRTVSDDFMRTLLLALGVNDPLILGIEEEWGSVAGISGTVRRCSDLFEMARLIKAAPLFIGTPSLPSSIAEGLKTPRLIHVPPNANDFPIGPLGFVIPTDNLLSMTLTHIRSSFLSS